MHALVLRQLTKIYKNGITALKAIDLTVDEGDFFALLGPNGAGKTTMLRLLAGVELADAGEIHEGHGCRIGYYAQEHEMLDAGASVFANLRGQAPPAVTDPSKTRGFSSARAAYSAAV